MSSGLPAAVPLMALVIPASPASAGLRRVQGTGQMFQSPTLPDGEVRLEGVPFQDQTVLASLTIDDTPPVPEPAGFGLTGAALRRRFPAQA